MLLSFYMKCIIKGEIIYLGSSMVKNTIKFMEFLKPIFKQLIPELVNVLFSGIPTQKPKPQTYLPQPSTRSL